MSAVLRKEQNALIDQLVAHYVSKKNLFLTALNSLQGCIDNSEELQNLVYSRKYRIKDPSHLKDKLSRKMKVANEKGEPFDITLDNLFLKINDLAGFRIIHLHTSQVQKIDQELKSIFKEYKWNLIEGPSARIWDDEYKTYFEGIGIDTVRNANMYTSVHYIVEANSVSSITCEIQVRTLIEEVWGEVDHLINYPHKTESNSCKEQIKVLARLTSGCSRLVDSIFNTHDEHKSFKKSSTEKKRIKKTSAKKASKKIVKRKALVKPVDRKSPIKKRAAKKKKK